MITFLPRKEQIVEFEMTFMERGLTKHYDFCHTQASKQASKQASSAIIM